MSIGGGGCGKLLTFSLRIVIRECTWAIKVVAEQIQADLTHSRVRMLVPLFSGVHTMCMPMAESFAWLWVLFGDAEISFSME